MDGRGHPRIAPSKMLLLKPSGQVISTLSVSRARTTRNRFSGLRLLAKSLQCLAALNVAQIGHDPGGFLTSLLAFHQRRPRYALVFGPKNPLAGVMPTFTWYSARASFVRLPK